LEAYVKHLTSKSGDINGAAEAALEAATETKKLVALAGRGSYVNQEDLLKADIPDPGAWGVWRLVDAIRGYQAKSQ
jgi:dihydroxyacetone kinase